ncbi:unnamed protein product, partial [Symbiodinium microadriaticum]
KLIIELNCLKEIVGEFLTHQLNQVDILNDHSDTHRNLDKEKEDFFFLHKTGSKDDRHDSDWSSQPLEIVDAVK